jgi:MoxR-like ATPase
MISDSLQIETPTSDGSDKLSARELDAACQSINRVAANVERVILGKREAIELVITGLLADGHVLLEDVPGVGKTMLARSLAQSISADFKRIQFTPDLLPADVTGSSIYNPKDLEFEFRRGPVFAHIVLADEINRTSPRTQSALLESMDERQVSVDGQTYPLPRPFFVIATQNPIEHAGTYDLPEAQLDRFMLRVRVGYPTVEHEAAILEAQRLAHPLDSLEHVCTPEDVISLQHVARRVFVKESLRRYISSLSAASREYPGVQVGVSVRGTQMLMAAAQAHALIRHRDFVLPDDVQEMALPCFSHRLVLQPDAQLAGVTAATVVNAIIENVKVPPQ